MSRLLDLWLDTGRAGIVLLPFLLCPAFAVAFAWLTFHSPARGFFAGCRGIVGPFFGSVGILFGLFSAFLASEVWQQTQEAREALRREADGVRTMVRFAEVLGPAGARLRTAAEGYGRWVLEEELPAIRAGAPPRRDLSHIRPLVEALAAPDLVAAAPPAIHQAVVDAFVELRHARADRLGITAHRGASLNWLGMLVLGVLTQLAIAVVHLEKARPQALALAVFTTAFAATVALIGLHERPFTGMDVSDEALRAALAPG